MPAERRGYEDGAGSPPDRSVGAFPTQSAAGMKVTAPLTAGVVDVVAFLQGDAALLEVSPQNPLPAVLVAAGSPHNGELLVASGYKGSVSQSVDFDISEPSSTTGDMSAQQTVGGVPFTEMTAATSAGMSGGPVVDMQGESWHSGSRPSWSRSSRSRSSRSRPSPRLLWRLPLPPPLRPPAGSARSAESRTAPKLSSAAPVGCVSSGPQFTWGEMHVGSRSVFEAAGFAEVSHPSVRRAVLRADLARP